MYYSSKTFFKIGVSVGTAVFLFLALFAALNATVLAAPDVASLLANDIRISQVYGGGGNTGAPYLNDFVELFNAGSTTVDITGWSIQYTSSGGNSWGSQKTALAGTVAAGHYYLIQLGGGANGVALPTPDATGTTGMAATSGKVALVSSTDSLATDTCPLGSTVVDFVGYGTANCSESSNAAPGLSNTTAAIRADGGCTDTDDNAADFTASAPTPRNTSSPTHSCATGPVFVISKSVEPQTAVTYQSPVTYTVILQNSGAVDETAVLFTDTLPISTTFGAWVEHPTGAAEVGNEITWTGTVTAGESITFTFTADQTADYSETITNTAEFSGTIAGTAQASFTVEDEPLLVDLVVEKTAPVYAVEGEIINYTVVISNDGSASADNVLFTDTLPAEIAYSSADPAYTSSPSDNVYVWDLSTIDLGTAVTINLTGTITNTMSATTLVSNTAEVSTSTVGDNLANNSTEAPTTLYPIVPIATVRTGSNGEKFAVQGQVIVVPGTYGYQEWALQDATGGISAYFTPPPTVQLGDTVILLGTRGAFNGQEQFTSNLYFRNVSSGPEVAPLPYTTGDVAAGSSEGWLVSVSGVIGDLACPTGLTIDDGSGPVNIYIDIDTGIDNLCDMGVQNGDMAKIIGFSTEYKGTFQIKPRRPSDIDLGVLQIRKEAPQLVAPGALFTYTLTANNQIGEPLTNIVISDVVPANTTFAYALDGGVESGGVVTWSIANLPHGNNISVQFAVTATNSLGTVVNDAYVIYASNYITPVTGLPTTTFIDEKLHIYQVQGEGFTSPLVGSDVTVSGEVVADFQGSTGMKGFFMQDQTGDGNMLTSDGIFVYDNTFGVAVNVGDVVTVTGEVVEFESMTEIGNVTAVITQTGSPSIPPTLVALPETTNGDLERYEGMWITLPQTMTVAQNYFQGQYGQVNLSSDGRLFQPTNVYTPTSAEAVALAASNARNYLTLDDGNADRYNNPIPTPYISPVDGTLRAGDTTSGLMGVLDEGIISSGSDPTIDYRLQPLDTAAISFTRVNERTTAPEAVGGRLQIASFNVLNYFTTLGSSYICGPSQDLQCRGAGNVDEFVRQRTKIITAIVSIDADIVGLMEIENNETAAITDLVTGLNAEAGADTYAFIDTGYIGGDAIKVAMIYQPANVTPMGTTAVLTDVFPFDTNTRPPLAQAFVENETGQEFIVVVNHFKSKGSPCDGDPDLGDGQGHCNLTRVQAADELVAWLKTNPTGTGDPDIFIIGDLNSYAQEDPITALKGHGYTNLIEQFTGTWAYSYVFDGQLGYLDHALASSSAQDSVTGVTEWHINADEPSALDYNDYNWEPLFNGDAYRASDHDPVLIGVSLKWIIYMPIMFK